MAADAAPFPYLRWARAHLAPDEPLSLGLSGLPRPPADEIGVPGPGLEDGTNPEQAWREAIASRYGVRPEQVHPAAGTSHANFAVYLAFARGGHVVSETPAYEAFLRLGAAVGAETTAVARRIGCGWRLDPDALAAAVRPDTRLLAVTDLHNPSGARLHPDDLALLVETARTVDAVVLVDEVYLDLDPLDRPTAARFDDRVLVTNSLTKSHGLWDLRAGWVIGHPERILEIERWEDLVCPRLAYPGFAAALDYLPQADERLLRVRARCAALTARVDAWVASREDVSWIAPPAGFTGLLDLGRPGRPLDGDVVARVAWDEHRVRVVPGSFFQRPTSLRISYYLDDASLDRALEGLGRALDAAPD